jgi:hypothetical protein
MGLLYELRLDEDELRLGLLYELLLRLLPELNELRLGLELDERLIDDELLCPPPLRPPPPPLWAIAGVKLSVRATIARAINFEVFILLLLSFRFVFRLFSRFFSTAKLQQITEEISPKAKYFSPSPVRPPSRRPSDGLKITCRRGNPACRDAACCVSLSTNPSRRDAACRVSLATTPTGRRSTLRLYKRKPIWYHTQTPAGRRGMPRLYRRKRNI